LLDDAGCFDTGPHRLTGSGAALDGLQVTGMDLECRDADQRLLIPDRWTGHLQQPHHIGGVAWLVIHGGHIHR
jgi:hypothetical protein